MRCRYARVCGCRCETCSQYKPESYYGEAEHVLEQRVCLTNHLEWRRYKQLEYEAFNRQEEAHYKALEEEYYRQFGMLIC